MFLIANGYSQNSETSQLAGNSISRTEAIEIADEEGCYPKGKNWKVEVKYHENFDLQTNVWHIYSHKKCSRPINHQGKHIWIDAQSGRVLFKVEYKDKYWAPPVYR